MGASLAGRTEHLPTDDRGGRRRVTVGGEVQVEDLAEGWPGRDPAGLMTFPRPGDRRQLPRPSTLRAEISASRSPSKPRRITISSRVPTIVPSWQTPTSRPYASS